MVVVSSRVIVAVLRRASDMIMYSRSLSWSLVKSSNKLHNPSNVSITNPWNTGSTIGKRSSSCVSLRIVKHSSQIRGYGGCGVVPRSATLKSLLFIHILESVSEPDGLPPSLPPPFLEELAPISPSSAACASVVRP